MNHRYIRLALALLGALALALAVGACGSKDKSPTASSSTSSPSAPSGQPGKGKPVIRMGDKNFTEEFILGELYKQALEAKGFTVKLTKNIGSSEVIDKELTAKKIDMYPEYTGVIQQVLAGSNTQATSADQAYQLAQAFESKRGFQLLEKTPFFDADGLAVLAPYAQKNGLKTIQDLSKVGSFSYGAPPENKTRFQGVVGLKKAYGLKKVKFVPLTIGLQYPALNKGKIDTAAIFTTDGQLKGGKYAVLTDTKGIFGFQNVSPVVSKSLLAAQGPAFAATLNAVSAKLTNEAMQTMNAAVDIDKQDPPSVALAFLKANGLI